MKSEWRTCLVHDIDKDLGVVSKERTDLSLILFQYRINQGGEYIWRQRALDQAFVC